MLSFIKKSRGDTIIEVMFATAIASLVIVLALTLMNRSFAQIQMAVETTFVRQAIDGEAEVLRYARDAYLLEPTVTTGGPGLWRGILAKTSSTTTEFGTCQPPPNLFFIARTNTDTSDPGNDAVDINNLVLATNYSNSETFARIGQGIWVEAVNGGVAGGSQFIDFHIRACWEPPFSSAENATLGTIVRLYYE